MGYIGKKPTSVPLTSSDIADGIISTADLANTAVTGAKVNTDVISAQTALASEPADTDEFLVSDAGVIKRIDYSLIKGGGSYNLLSTATVSSGVSEVDITSNIDNTYLNYLITITNLHIATDNAVVRMRFFSSDGSPDTGSVYRVAAIGWKSDSAQRSHDGTIDCASLGNENADNANSSSQDFRIFLSDPSGTTFFKHAEFTASIHNVDDYAITKRGLTQYRRTSAITGVRIYMSSGNIDSGVFKLYGIT